MRVLLIGLLLSMVVATLVSAAQVNAAIAVFGVTGSAKAVDGDTVAIEDPDIGTMVRLRIWGISAPERGHPKWALSRDVMASVLAENGLVACRVAAAPAAGRPVVRCMLEDGRDLGRVLVERGAARDCPAFSGGEYADAETPEARELPLPPYCLVAER